MPMVQITISLSDDEVMRLDRIADAVGQSRASLVRTAVRRTLPHWEKDELVTGLTPPAVPDA